MRYVEVDGKRASVLGFGCSGVLGRVGRRGSLRAMAAAWEGGVTLFDTARSYGYGEAEGLLGEFLEGRREKAVVVTKFGIWPEPMPGWKRRARPLVRAGLRLFPGARGTVRRVGVSGTSSAGRFDAATLRQSLEESLRQLRTNYVDILLMHEASAEAMRRDTVLAELEAVVREGKARRVGVSVTAEVAREVGGAWPDWVRVTQAPARVFGPAGIDGFELRSEQRMVMGNHPFGVGDRARAAIAALREIAADPAVDAGLREKLRGEGREVLARVVFGAAWAAGVEIVVPSMLHARTVRANLAAIEAAGMSAQELAVLRQRVG